MAVTPDDHMPTTTLNSSSPGAYADQTIGQEFLAALDEIDFDAIERRYGLAPYSERHDVENHVKVGALDGITPSTTLEILAANTAKHYGVEYLCESRFSELTNGRPCQAVMVVPSELLHSPDLYQCQAHLRNRLDWLDCPGVASDASNLLLTAPITVSDGLVDSTDDGEITPEDGGPKLLIR